MEKINQAEDWIFETLSKYPAINADLFLKMADDDGLFENGEQFFKKAVERMGVDSAIVCDSARNFLCLALYLPGWAAEAHRKGRPPSRHGPIG